MFLILMPSRVYCILRDGRTCGESPETDHSLRPKISQPEPDEELLAKLCGFPPLSKAEGLILFLFLSPCHIIGCYPRERSMSPASSSSRTSRPFAPTPGLRSKCYIDTRSIVLMSPNVCRWDEQRERGAFPANL